MRWVKKGGVSPSTSGLPSLAEDEVVTIRPGDGVPAAAAEIGIDTGAAARVVV